MPVHIIDGKGIYYQSHGQGTPLVMIHGSLSSHRLWDLQRPLAVKFKLILIDLPGHGQSDSLEGEITVSRIAQILAQLIKELNLNSVVLMGHSLGGAIALHLTLDYVNLSQNLILVGTGAKLGVLPAILEGLQTNYQEGIDLTIGQLGFAPNADPVLIERSKRECLKCPQPVGYTDFVACNNFDVRNRLGEIRVPTLILVGDQDQLTPVKWSRFLAEHIQDAELKVIKNAGHMVMLEQARLVNAAVTTFLE